MKKLIIILILLQGGLMAEEKKDIKHYYDQAMKTKEKKHVESMKECCKKINKRDTKKIAEYYFMMTKAMIHTYDEKTDKDKVGERGNMIIAFTYVYNALKLQPSNAKYLNLTLELVRKLYKDPSVRSMQEGRIKDLVVEYKKKTIEK